MTTEEYHRLTTNCQPHPVFKLDWSAYYALDFGDTFLPKVPYYKGKAFHFFDGAELLINAEKVVRNLMQLNKSKNLLTPVFYTYPKGVLAEKMKEAVQVDDFGMCVFVEVYQNDNLDIRYKFGQEFKDFLNTQINEKKLKGSSSSIESTTYKSTISKLKNEFNNEISHFNMLSFVGKTIGLNLKEVHEKSAVKAQIHTIKIVSSEPANNQDAKKKQKWVEVEFEIFNQSTTSHIFKVLQGKDELVQMTFLPEVTITSRKDKAKSSANEKGETPTQPPGKYVVKWDITNNKLFDTKDEKLKLTFKIQATTPDKQTAISTKDFLVKDAVEKTEKNNYITIIDPNKKDNDEGAQIQVFGKEIIARQEAFLKLIPIDIYNKLTEECKLILNLPVIMTKLDFLHGALCQIHWLEGSSNTLKFPYQFFMSEDRVKDIDVKNLQEYFRSIEYLSEENLGYSPSNPDGENKFLYNDSIPAINTALDIFNESLEKRAEGGDIGGDEKLINEMRQWLAIKNDVKKRRENTSINLFQSFSEGSASGDIDDLGVAVGMYSQRCYYRGSISKNTDANKWVLSINEVICRFSDDFSFNDNLIDFGPIEYSQPLGCWINDIKKPEKPEKQKITDLKRVCLQNIDYQELKKELSKALPNSCNDFFIFSDFKSFKDEFIQKDIIIF